MHDAFNVLVDDDERERLIMYHGTFSNIYLGGIESASEVRVMGG